MVTKLIAPNLLFPDIDCNAGDRDLRHHGGSPPGEADGGWPPGGGQGRPRLLRRHLGPGAGPAVHCEGAAEGEAGAEAEAGV